MFCQVWIISGIHDFYYNMNGSDVVRFKQCKRHKQYNSIDRCVVMALFLSAGDFMNWDYWMKTSGSEVVKLLQLVSWSPDVSAIIVNTLLSAEKVCITSSYCFLLW